MKFSIITICMNSENVIRRTIESVLQQDYDGGVEYFIIDGASKDNTVKIAEEYTDRFKQKGYDYTVSSESDSGIYDAMNKGIKKCIGDIVGIINSGDWYEPIALSAVAKTYQEEKFDLFYADLNLVKENGDIIVKHSKMDRIVSSRHWNHPTTFVTRETYSSLGLFRCEGLHDDFEFILRARKANKKIVIRNVILADFLVGGASNNKGFKKSIRRIKDRYNSYRLNGYSPLYMIECVLIEVAKTMVLN